LRQEVLSLSKGKKTGEIPVTPQRRAAFFDFDGTLIRGDSQVMEAPRRLRHERHPVLFARRLIPTMVDGVLAGLGLISQCVHNQAYLRTYRGCKAVDLIGQGEALFQSKIRRAFIPQVLEIMAAHQHAGDAIVIVSAAPQHILAPVASYLKPDFLICTRLETDPLGRCTGRSLGAICIGADKAKRIRDLAACHHLDLTTAHAYSDHHADLPMLTSVGQPQVVNPSKPLETTARKHGWPIHNF
jgi:HAD superfamily hydrolase (TIGR01490 family)